MRDNPLDARVKSLVGAMNQQAKFMRGFSRGVTPFNSEKLTPEQQRAIYQDPTRMFPGQEFPPDPELAANMARQQMVQSMGPVDYVKWVEKMEQGRVSGS